MELLSQKQVTDLLGTLERIATALEAINEREYQRTL